MSELHPELCWFCGKTYSYKSTWGSHCLGRQVYSSDLTVSAEDNNCEKRPSDTSLHFREDLAFVCRECVFERAATVSVLGEYIVSQIDNREKAWREALDYDSDLTRWSERQWLYSCWFEHYSSSDVSRHYTSLSLFELFGLGWRLKGKVRFEETQLSAFFARFADPYHPGSDNFYGHIAEHIIIPDTSLLSRFAGVRAHIFDLTIVEFALKDAHLFADKMLGSV